MADTSLYTSPRESRPWDRPQPEFTYSESQDRRRRHCARAHHHAVYTAHQGWSAPQGSTAWLAYRLKQAQTLAAAVGTTVHEAATRCVRALTTGDRLPTVDVLYSEAAAHLNALWRNSRGRRQAFWGCPKDAPLYLEALYGIGPTADALSRARVRLRRVLEHLVRCEGVWAWVRSAAPDDVMLVDPFFRFMLADPVLPDGVPCYAAPDLLVRPAPNAPWYIIDFKSGRADGVVDQVLTYGLAARDGLQLDLSAGCRGVVVALGGLSEADVCEFSIVSADLEAAAARIRAGITARRALLADPVRNIPLPLSAIPSVLDISQCRWCAYRVLCHPRDYQLDGVALRPNEL